MLPEVLLWLLVCGGNTEETDLHSCSLWDGVNLFLGLVRVFLGCEMSVVSTAAALHIPSKDPLTLTSMLEGSNLLACMCSVKIICCGLFSTKTLAVITCFRGTLFWGGVSTNILPVSCGSNKLWCVSLYGSVCVGCQLSSGSGFSGVHLRLTTWLHDGKYVISARLLKLNYHY